MRCHIVFTVFRFFRISGRTGSGNPDCVVPLDSLSQARSVGAKSNFLGALVQPQQRQTGKTVFPDFRANRFRETGYMGTVGILRSSPIRGYPYLVHKCPGGATIVKNSQNRKTGSKTG